MMKTPLILTDDEGKEVKLPTKRQVCSRCGGDGVHDHPAFSNGITQDEMEEAGPDFREEYLGGRYDVRCEVCKGRNVEDVPDPDQMTPEVLALYEAYCESERTCRAVERMERLMGA